MMQEKRAQEDSRLLIHEGRASVGTCHMGQLPQPNNSAGPLEERLEAASATDSLMPKTTTTTFTSTIIKVLGGTTVMR